MGIRITAPPELAGDYEDSMSYKVNWTEASKKELEARRRYNDHHALCMTGRFVGTTVEHNVCYPSLKKTYEREDKCFWTGAAGFWSFLKEAFLFLVN